MLDFSSFVKRIIFVNMKIKDVIIVCKIKVPYVGYQLATPKILIIDVIKALVCKKSNI